ncbi:MAG: CDP-diacylglycerol--serine O-phosphatidyltransferase, partial [Gammaproteobacteria bacterium]|nr:CDP-diacylglycerol--serine O-phosphatidyltransferase [Gammaproteobacteria bacterium]
MTQDARDQEPVNSDQSHLGQSASTQSEKIEQPEVISNEDLASAFLRETEVIEETVEDGKKIR